jgi:hypothetical protein
MATETKSESTEDKKISSPIELRNQARDNMKKAGLDEKDISEIRAGKMQDAVKIMKANKAWAEANPASPLGKYIKQMDVNFKDSAEAAVNKLKDIQTKLWLNPDGVVGTGTSVAWNKRLELKDKTKEKEEAEAILADLGNTFQQDSKRLANRSEVAAGYSDKEEMESSLPGLSMDDFTEDGKKRFSTWTEEQKQKLAHLDEVTSNGSVDAELASIYGVGEVEAQNYLTNKNANEKELKFQQALTANPELKGLFDTIDLFEQSAANEYAENVRKAMTERVINWDKEWDWNIESDWNKTIKQELFRQVARSIIANPETPMADISPDEMNKTVNSINRFLGKNNLTDYKSFIAEVAPEKSWKIVSMLSNKDSSPVA